VYLSREHLRGKEIWEGKGRLEMTSLDVILSSVSESAIHGSGDLDPSSLAIEKRALKRRRLMPPVSAIKNRDVGEMDGLGASEYERDNMNGRGNRVMIREERKKKWLERSTHEELLGIVLGGIWSGIISHLFPPPN